jgi:small-conductance mechanosensitive channel
MLEEIGPGVLVFSLQVYVPDPSIAGRVKHRLASQIQKRFRTQGIEIPVPKQELKFQASDFEALIAKLATGAGVEAGAAPAFPPSTPHLRIDRPAPNAIIE